MRPLTDDETKVFFTKLSLYLGPNIKFLLDRSDSESDCITCATGLAI